VQGESLARVGETRRCLKHCKRCLLHYKMFLSSASAAVSRAEGVARTAKAAHPQQSLSAAAALCN
jgi:hypothetical protein